MMDTPGRQPLLRVGPGGGLFQFRNQEARAARRKLRFAGANIIKMDSRTSLVSGASR
jgi:hypothetical protein